MLHVLRVLRLLRLLRLLLWTLRLLLLLLLLLLLGVSVLIAQRAIHILAGSIGESQGSLLVHLGCITPGSLFGIPVARSESRRRPNSLLHPINRSIGGTVR